MVNLNSLKGKVANGGSTTAGVLLSTDWNTLVTAVEEVQAGVTTARTDSTQAKTDAAQAKTDATLAKTTATQAKTESAGAKTTAESADAKATQAKTTADTALEKANEALGKSQLLENKEGSDRVAPFADIVETGTIRQQSTSATNGQVVYVRNRGIFAYRVGGTGGNLYNNWPGTDRYFGESRSVARSDQLYFCGKKLYIYDDTVPDLVLIADIDDVIKASGGTIRGLLHLVDGIRMDGEEGSSGIDMNQRFIENLPAPEEPNDAATKQYVDQSLSANIFCNVCETIGVEEFTGLVDAIGQMNERFLADNNLATRWRRKGVIFTYKNSSKNGHWDAYQWLGGTASQFIDLSLWSRFGGSTINSYEENEWGENGENVNLIEGEFYAILEQ